MGGGLVKYIRLESYEDTLQNLETDLTDQQESVLTSKEAGVEGGFKERYFLRYLLDVETRNSQSLLNLRSFSDPGKYKLSINRTGTHEKSEINVDLLETFNWLIGLKTNRVTKPQSYFASFKRDSENRLRLKGQMRQGKNGDFWFRTVTGVLPDGRQTLVIWRKLNGNLEQDNLVLDTWFSTQGYLSRDTAIDLIYVNGDNNLKNLKTDKEHWNVRLIEEDFMHLMFQKDHG